MTLRVVLHGVKQKHEIYYLNDIFVCRFDVNANCDYDFTNDSYIFRFFNVSRESINEIVETVDRQLNAFNYEFITKTEDLGFIFTMNYYVRKKEDSNYVTLRMPPRGSAKSFLNDIFGVRSNSGRYTARKRRSKYDVKAIYKGIERSTGKFKTVVIWNESTREVALNKTTTVCRIDGPSNDIQAFAYAYVKREYGSNSAFKRHVDKHTINFVRSLFFDDGEYQAQISVLSNKDIYDQVALVMTFRDFGGAKNVIELVEEKTFNE